MADSNLGLIDPDTTSGADLARRLEYWGALTDTTKIGPTRPDGAQHGTLWINTGSAGVGRWALMMYCGNNFDITLLVFNPVNGQIYLDVAGIVGVIKETRTLSTVGSLTGGGNFSANRVMKLVNDIALGQMPSGAYYYGTTGNGDDRGWHPLPSGGGGNGGAVSQSPVKRTLATYGAGTYDILIPSSITGIFLWAYGGGSTQGLGQGGCMSGKIDTTPGSTLHVVVGGPGEATVIGGALVCPPGQDDTHGAASIPNGFDFVAAAPVLQGLYPGYPQHPGMLWMEYIGT